ncbi:BTAD domain-containing putative transcriptional regulator [Lentzea sp. NPDC006480]|uniref:AfsR/SARP family transcriptional regulator n=1 Tax=Lentzea sp. NPDC006480 TaxID=3157176 RepID=UPI0033AC05E4
MSVEFRVLGRIEVRARGTNIALGSLKQRLLLATLLLSPGRPVPIRRLVRALWADEPPMSAMANLRTYANRLRQVLPDGCERIAGRQAGYQLTLRPGELDLHLFTERAEAGRTALARGDHAAAARHLGEALSACRGAVLEDLAGCAALAGSIAPVEELRLSVTEDHFDARLGLGEHHSLITPLREFVAEHPLRERPRAHLVTALYRSGDLAGALAVYTDYRGVIADRLGLEPSPELVRLHQAVLDRDPSLSKAVTVRATSVPRELPSPCRSFSGRQPEVARLQALLAQDTPAVAVVHGPCGVGKSALALEVAHRVAPVFPDGQLYIDLGQATRVPHRLLRHLGVSDVPHAEEEATALLRSRLADRAVLVVLDGATDPAPLRFLLPATGPCALLVTSRAPLLLDGAAQLPLGPLSDVDGLELLTRLAPRAAFEPAAAAQIVSLCHGIPLALHIAGALLAHRPTRSLSRWVRRLAPERRRLAELSFGGESVRAACATVFSAVDDPLAANAFRLLGRYDMCDAATAADVLGTGLLETEAALDHLVDLGLAEWGDGDTYRLPGLMRLFATELTSPNTTRPPMAGPWPVLRHGLAP